MRASPSVLSSPLPKIGTQRLFDSHPPFPVMISVLYQPADPRLLIITQRGLFLFLYNCYDQNVEVRDRVRSPESKKLPLGPNASIDP
eukprot:2604505-Rhodomonas_salina.1